MAYIQKRDEVKELRDKIKLSPEGAYLFWGEEEYLKHHYLGELRKIVEEEGMAEFNRTVIDFQRDGTLSELKDAIDTPPIMAEHKIVEVWGLNITSLKTEDAKKLVEIVKKVSDGIILVIFARADELDISSKKSRETQVIKGLLSSSTVAQFPRQSENKLISWVDKLFTSQSMRISDVNIGKMIKLCDFSMTRLKSESEKIIASCKFYNLDTVPKDMVDLFVKPTAENEVYEFQEAVLKKSFREAFLILENLRQHNVEPIPIVASLSKSLNVLSAIKSSKGKKDDNEIASVTGAFPWQVKKYRPFANLWSESELKKAFELVFVCDTELKNIVSPPFVLLTNMLSQISGNEK